MNISGQCTKNNNYKIIKFLGQCDKIIKTTFNEFITPLKPLDGTLKALPVFSDAKKNNTDFLNASTKRGKVMPKVILSLGIKETIKEKNEKIFNENNEKCDYFGKDNKIYDNELLKSRAFPFTLYGKDDINLNELKEQLKNLDNVRYLIMGHETCKTTDRKHWQGFIYFYGEISFNQCIKRMKNIFKCHTFHIAFARGTIQDNYKYCTKKEFPTENKIIFEHNTKPNGQGERIDLEGLKNKLLTGEIDLDWIKINEPIKWAQYHKCLGDIQQVIYKQNKRTEKTKLIWLFGETGTGKSAAAAVIAKTDYKSVYTINYDDYARGWWESYKQEDVIIINEFRGQIKYDDLLEMGDITDFYTVCVRQLGQMPFNSKCVIITSPMRPEEIYKNRHAKDSIKQLLRRADIFEVKGERIGNSEKFNINLNCLNKSEEIQKTKFNIKYNYKEKYNYLETMQTANNTNNNHFLD